MEIVMLTKKDIIEKAFILFANKGFAETSTGDIASAVGLKKQSLYSHFASKNEIIGEVFKEQSFFIMNEIDKRLNDIVSQPVDIFFKEIFKGYVDIFRDHNRLLLWKRVVLILHNEEYQDIFNEDQWQFSKNLSEALFEKTKQAPFQIDHHKFESFFLSYMVLIQGYLDWMIIAKPDDAIFNITWDNFWNGTKDLLK